MTHVPSIYIQELPKIKSRTLLSEIQKTGCFILRDCLDTELVDQVHAALVALFSLPPERKKQHAIDKKKDPLAHGFSPFGVAKALDSGIPNLLETWDISPTKENWPEELNLEWNIIRTYQKSLKQISINSLHLLERTLEAKEEELLGLVDTDSIEGIHLIHYFPIESGHQNGARRQSMHCDNTLITLIPSPLPINTGLSVFDRTNNDWETVLIERGSCLVQAGLLLEFITRGEIKANLHTVDNPEIDSKENKSRYSAPFFCSPKPNSRLQYLNKYQQKIDPISVEEFEKNYFRSIF
ncbi:2OG-Fe(II) oxygenase family protein [Roseibium sp. M-1]